VFSKGDKAKDELAKLNELRHQYNELFVFLELNAASLATKSSQSEFEQMREYARVMVQYFDSYSRVGTGSVARDLFMADNFRRLVGREAAGTRFVLWAHNLHITTTDSNGMYRRLVIICDVFTAMTITLSVSVLTRVRFKLVIPGKKDPPNDC
jgi:erythromycin esterase-like protein